MKHAWIYIGAKGSSACKAPEDYKKYQIDVLKPEYATVTNTGVIRRTTMAQSAGCNSYSPANAAEVKKYSKEQYFLISANKDGMAALCATAIKRRAGINVIVKLLDECKFTGAELDFEGYGKWTVASYTNYKKFLTELGNALHAKGYKLMVCGPPISNAKEQGYYKWKYEEINKLPVDYIVVMAYDYQFDYGAGSSVAPIKWVEAICDWTKARVGIDKLVMGIPSYGYHGTTGEWDIVIDTKEQTIAAVGNTGVRNVDGELVVVKGDQTYVYQDSVSLKRKHDAITAKGIKHESIWHLGGNDWFKLAQ